jgi:hemolysin III
MFILYLCSTLYHAVVTPKAKAVLNIFDHSAIYLLIAGSYTPFCLYFMRAKSPGWGWAIFGVIWGLAIIGIVFQSIFINKFRALSTTTYVLMGWIVIIAIYPLYNAMGLASVLWIALGGVIYSLGVIFYAMKQVKYMHAIWHVFVLAGTLIHFGLLLYKLICK